ncbi:hypothetical protein FKW77_010560 [Venturia effusa]|uniref:Major facilitator superfamily (MFS) profile domain-containing protein n=1 Tax=Venturia effusa TaxID=50376 RepID=A0A517L0L1_9PEZI|nr:hypothetical protein FKW77_010560 [Venturia effusa]
MGAGIDHSRDEDMYQPSQETLAHFNAILWCRPTLLDPDFRPCDMSRTVSDEGLGHTLMAKTWNTSDTIGEMLSFYKAPSLSSRGEAGTFAYKLAKKSTLHKVEVGSHGNIPDESATSPQDVPAIRPKRECLQSLIELGTNDRKEDANMGLGILEDVHMDMPPGTSRLSEKFEINVPREVDAAGRSLKKRGDVVLIPQPSDDPNDPLNWSNAWKLSILAILGLSLAIANALGPMLTPGLVVIAKHYHVDHDLVDGMMLGLLAFCTGSATFFVAAGADIWGKRPFYVTGMVFLLGSCIWGFASKNFASLAAARALQGFAAAPLECLVVQTVGDLSFLHERGTRLAVWGTMIPVGVGAAQVISGFIIKNLGVNATFGICALWFALLLPITYFCVFETTYVRKQIRLPLRDCPGTSDNMSRKSGSVQTESKEDEGGNVDGRESESESRIKSRTPGIKGETGSVKVGSIEEIDMEEPIPGRELYRSRLRLFRGRIVDKPFWRGVWKPIPLIAYPAILFSTIVHGKDLFSLADWYGFHWEQWYRQMLMRDVAEVLVSLQVLTKKPYNLDPSQIGLTKIPHMIAALVFAPLAGVLSDWIAKFMTKKNDGIFEPEFRLMLMLIAVPVSTASFVGFGLAAERKQSVAWILFWGVLQSVSSPFGTQAAVSYILDCYPQDMNQALVTIMFTKAVALLVVSSKVAGWYQAVGARSVMFTCAGINIGISLFTIPAYIYGKRFRSIIARSKLAAKYVEGS